jgi:hypothetical protein
VVGLSRDEVPTVAKAGGHHPGRSYTQLAPGPQRNFLRNNDYKRASDGNIGYADPSLMLGISRDQLNGYAGIRLGHCGSPLFVYGRAVRRALNAARGNLWTVGIGLDYFVLLVTSTNLPWLCRTSANQRAEGMAIKF